MTTGISAEPVPIQMDGSGTYRIAETRVTLDSVLAAYQSGATAEAIADRFPSIGLADVYAVISWYLHHMEQAHEYLRARHTEAEQLRQQVEQRFPADGLRQRLLCRQKNG
ncbi:MAG: DUF433 domain-containing protein [Candidatus Saccharimonas sp.]|nr:DUF433 domain-containing protein [Planctomycetaceae bacterium]